MLVVCVLAAATAVAVGVLWVGPALRGLDSRGGAYLGGYGAGGARDRRPGRRRPKRALGVAGEGIVLGKYSNDANGVRAWLQDNNITRSAEVLVNAGVDTMADLLDVTEDDRDVLTEEGLKKMKFKRLVKAVNAANAANAGAGETEADANNGGDNGGDSGDGRRLCGTTARPPTTVATSTPTSTPTPPRPSPLHHAVQLAGGTKAVVHCPSLAAGTAAGPAVGTTTVVTPVCYTDAQRLDDGSNYCLSQAVFAQKDGARNKVDIVTSTCPLDHSWAGSTGSESATKTAGAGSCCQAGCGAGCSNKGCCAAGKTACKKGCCAAGCAKGCSKAGCGTCAKAGCSVGCCKAGGCCAAGKSCGCAAGKKCCTKGTKCGSCGSAGCGVGSCCAKGKTCCKAGCKAGCAAAGCASATLPSIPLSAYTPAHHTVHLQLPMVPTMRQRQGGYKGISAAKPDDPVGILLNGVLVYNHTPSPDSFDACLGHVDTDHRYEY